jgi:hypothetical protein
MDSSLRLSNLCDYTVYVLTSPECKTTCHSLKNSFACVSDPRTPRVCTVQDTVIVFLGRASMLALKWVPRDRTLGRPSKFA